MPVGYLITVVLLGGLTAVALAPPRPPATTPSHWTFWAGFLINEQPFLPLYWLTASSALAAAEGDLNSAAGLVVLGLAVLTAAGLAVIAVRVRSAPPALRRALDEGLGAGWRGEIDPALAPRPGRPPLMRILLTPWFVARPGVRRVASLRYGPAGRRHLLDVYHHRSRPAGAPMMVHFHGGGFRRGRKSRESRVLLEHLAARGWVCISANYRLSPAVRFPDHLVDAKRVIAWAREHGPEYGASGTEIFATGGSAGAHLSATLALTPNDPRFQPGFEDADTSIAGAVLLYGYYGSIDGGQPDATPLSHLRPDAPPVLALHGALDTLVLVEDARDFAGRLRAVSQGPVVYAELPGTQHTFDMFHSMRMHHVVQTVDAFTAWVRSRAGRYAPGR